MRPGTPALGRAHRPRPDRWTRAPPGLQRCDWRAARLGSRAYALSCGGPAATSSRVRRAAACFPLRGVASPCRAGRRVPIAARHTARALHEMKRRHRGRAANRRRHVRAGHDDYKTGGQTARKDLRQCLGRSKCAGGRRAWSPASRMADAHCVCRLMCATGAQEVEPSTKTSEDALHLPESRARFIRARRRG